MNSSVEQDIFNIDLTDSLDKYRSEDYKTINNYLVNHQVYGGFFQRHIELFKSFLKLEEYHQDTIFVRSEELNSRKIYFLISGEVAAYTLVKNTPKPQHLYKYKSEDVLTDFGALFNTQRHFGLQALSDCKLVSLDLQYIEDAVIEQDLDKDSAQDLYKKINLNQDSNINISSKIYSELIDLVYSDTLESNTEVLNNRLKNKLELKNLLKEYKLFKNIDNLNEKELNKLAERLKYINFDHNEVVLDETNSNKIYLLEAGFVKEDQYISDNDNIYKSKEIHRYNIVGENNLSTNNKTKTVAITKAKSCLLELDLTDLIVKNSVASVFINYLNNKVVDAEEVLYEKNDQELANKDYYKYVSFSLVAMGFLGFYGVLINFHKYLPIVSTSSLFYHALVFVLIVAGVILILKPREYNNNRFGLTTNNLKTSINTALFFAILFIIIITGIKDLYLYFYGTSVYSSLFTPDLIINDNLDIGAFSLFILIYVFYICFYEFCIRGLVQNIFLDILSGSRIFVFWGSIFASSFIGSQFSMDLFQDFSMTYFLCDLGCGIIFARTRNLWGVLLFRLIVQLYLVTILGILPNTYF